MTTEAPRLPFTADPVIAEAKSRRRRRLLAVGMTLALAVGATGLGVELTSRGAGSAGTESRTNLTLSAVSEFSGRPIVFRLSCDPPGGDLPQPAKACAAIAAQPSLITKPEPSTCWGYGWEFSIIGRLNGRPVHTQVASCWTKQMALIKFDPRFVKG